MNAETGTALALPAGAALTAAFTTEGGLDGIIDRIEKEVRSHAPDLSTKKGRDAIASLAYQVSRSKTALDGAGKVLTEDMRKRIGAVDADRKKARDRLDALRDEIRQPLTDWEAAEEKRVAALKARLDRLQSAADVDGWTAAQMQDRIMAVADCAIDDSWAEYLPMAAKAKDAALQALRVKHTAQVQLEAERDELERLRQMEAEREEAERVRLAAEAADRAEEERKARAAADEARIEREKADAAERARQEAETRAAREAEEREAQHQRDLAAAKAREEAAAQAERDRIAAEKRAEDEAQRRREENTRIRNRVKREIAAALADFVTHEAMAEAMVAGRIPHTRVTF